MKVTTATARSISRSRASKPAHVAFGGGDGIGLGELHFHLPDNTQLSNTITSIYSKGNLAKVNEDDFQLAAVAGIDHPCQSADAFQSQAGPVVDERAEFRGNSKASPVGMALISPGANSAASQAETSAAKSPKGPVRVVGQGRRVELGNLYVTVRRSPSLRVKIVQPLNGTSIKTSPFREGLSVCGRPRTYPAAAGKLPRPSATRRGRRRGNRKSWYGAGRRWAHRFGAWR